MRLQSEHSKVWRLIVPHSTDLIISGGNCAQDLFVILPLYTGVLLAIVGEDEQTAVVVVEIDEDMGC